MIFISYVSKLEDCALSEPNPECLICSDKNISIFMYVNYDVVTLKDSVYELMKMFYIYFDI